MLRIAPSSLHSTPTIPVVITFLFPHTFLHLYCPLYSLLRTCYSVCLLLHCSLLTTPSVFTTHYSHQSPYLCLFPPSLPGSHHSLSCLPSSLLSPPNPLLTTCYYLPLATSYSPLPATRSYQPPPHPLDKRLMLIESYPIRRK